VGKFAEQLQAFAEKTDNTLRDVDVAFKLSLFNRVVRKTRVADPASWKRPDPDYLGGTMRGNWQVSTGAPSGAFLEGVRNTAFALSAGEAGKITPFSVTYLSNNTPYVLHWEEQDAMVSLAIADAKRALEEAVRGST